MFAVASRHSCDFCDREVYSSSYKKQPRHCLRWRVSSFWSETRKATSEWIQHQNRLNSSLNRFNNSTTLNSFSYQEATSRCGQQGCRNAQRLKFWSVATSERNPADIGTPTKTVGKLKEKAWLTERSVWLSETEDAGHKEPETIQISIQGNLNLSWKLLSELFFEWESSALSDEIFVFSYCLRWTKEFQKNADRWEAHGGKVDYLKCCLKRAVLILTRFSLKDSSWQLTTSCIRFRHLSKK